MSINGIEYKVSDPIYVDFWGYGVVTSIEDGLMIAFVPGKDSFVYFED